MKLSQTLNPKLFLENRLRPEVREKILRIVDEFLSTIELVNDINVLDIILVGSNASYNYTQYSDLDVHLVMNFEDFCDEVGLVQELFNSERALFRKNYDIKIKGIPVELYVEDIEATTVSNGIYSVVEDVWIKFPEPVSSSTEDIRHSEEFRVKFRIALTDVDRAISSDSIEESASILNQLYLMRKRSIDISGEYGCGNLIFKEIRNLGLLDALKDHILDLKSKDLSLEGLKKNSETVIIKRGR